VVAAEATQVRWRVTARREAAKLLNVYVAS
jgi:hypothetical protein